MGTEIYVDEIESEHCIFHFIIITNINKSIIITALILLSLLSLPMLFPIMEQGSP